ncbi:SWD3 [Candida oxycetoniae]|uniref:SWD3 n=1 Tax=Candida oxycetoniae TaxID=497107 RepID=A0AAI9SWN5_9ASCO|nr:SWD3 [Candida oxycetoniae]KAI3404239.2 SWD3 [Candida oxycetoniae]
MGVTLHERCNDKDTNVDVDNDSDGASANIVKENEYDLYNLVYTFKETQPVTAVRISPDGTLLAVSTAKVVRIFNLETRGLVTELVGHTKNVSDIKFSPTNSSIIASCSDDLTIRIWSFNKRASSSKCLKVFKKHTYHVTTIQFNSKGNLLISGSADETITIWDIISGRSLTTLAAHSDPISSLTLTPDNSIIISASYDGLIRLFDLETFQCLKTLTTNTSHGTATVSLSTKDLQNFPIGYVEISPNGKFVLSTSLDGVIRLWNYMENKVVKTFIAGEDSVVCVKYNCESKFVTFSGNSSSSSSSSSSRSSRSSSLIVSGSDSNGILCWDIKSKSLVWHYKGEQKGNKSISPVLSLDTFEEGRVLVSGALDGVVNVFEINPQAHYREEQDSGVH